MMTKIRMTPPEHGGLQPSDIDIWTAALDRPEEELQRYADLLSGGELARSARFRFARDRKRYVARHAILRMILSAYVRCSPRDVEIRSDLKGKPYIFNRKNSPALQFSMSYSAGLALFAFVRFGKIGVDVEQISAFPEMMELAAMNFKPAELQGLAGCSEKTRAELFFSYWGRKEAVLKASGEGLSIPLNQVDVSSLSCEAGSWGVCRILGGASGREFRLMDLKVEPGFAAAVAFESSSFDHAATYKDFEAITPHGQYAKSH
jgi:4'-phosphopantetheinyl transferase